MLLGSGEKSGAAARLGPFSSPFRLAIGRSGFGLCFGSGFGQAEILDTTASGVQEHLPAVKILPKLGFSKAPVLVCRPYGLATC